MTDLLRPLSTPIAQTKNFEQPRRVSKDLLPSASLYIFLLNDHLYVTCRGGVVWWGDSIGVKYVHEKLSKWSQLYGGFFKPSAFLAERASKGVKLVSSSIDSAYCT